MTDSDAQLVSLQVGQPKVITSDVNGQPMPAWETGIFKSAVSGPVRVTPTGFIGDGQADLKVHGGPDKAVCVYVADHYSAWRNELSLPDMNYGGFGENVTIQGWHEDLVCIGDRWQIGQTIFEVTQPRQPCVKLSRRWGLNSLPALVIATGRTGWYLRVLQISEVTAPSPIHRLANPHPDWTITRANQVMHRDRSDLDAAAELASLPQLAESWKQSLRKRLSGRAS